jgi:hypothetical protein
MYFGLAIVWVLMHMFDPCLYVSNFTGLDRTTYERMILYYRLMTKVD